MNKQSVKFFGEQSAEENLQILKRTLPQKSIIVEFEGNPYFKEFLAHFFTANNLEFVQELIGKLAGFRIEENKFDNHVDTFYDDKNFYIKRSFFISAIVTYARCFNSPKGKIKKLDIKHLLKQLPDDLVLDENKVKDRLLAIHEKVITLRNKYIAHVEDTHFETVKAFLTLEYDGKMLEHSLRGIYLGTYNFDEEEMQDWILLNSYLIKKVSEKQSELTELFFQSISKQELLKLAAEAAAFKKD